MGENGQNAPVGQNSKKRNIIIIVVIAVVLVVGMIVGIIFAIKGDKKVDDDGLVDIVSKRDVKATISTSGVLDSVESEAVTSSLMGSTVKNVYVREGEHIAPGQIICQLDTSSLQQQYAELQKSIAQAKADKIKSNQEYDKEVQDALNERNAGIDEINQQIFIAQVNYDNTAAELDRQRIRYMQYLQDPNHSEWDMEAIEMESNISDLETSLEVNKSIVNVYQSVRDSILEAGDGTNYVDELRNSINGVTDGTISSLEEAAREVQNSIGQGTVRSTVGGVITSLGVKQGDTYIGGSICTVENDNALLIHTQVNESKVADVSEGMKVIITTDATGSTELTGVVTYVAPRAASTSTSGNAADVGAKISASFGSSGSYLVKVSLNEQNSRLRLGMNAKLKIITNETENALSIPSAALQEDKDGKFVELVTNMDKVDDGSDDSYKKEKVYVNVGVVGDDYAEVHGTGIKEGEYVYIPADSQKMYDELKKWVENYSGE